MPPPDTVDQLVLSHLDAANLPDTSTDLVLAALLGERELADMLGGSDPPLPRPPAPEPAASESSGTYLASVEVAGFRGIGAAATLPLVPGPGLTIVMGRNGSGKSSFAEAAEFAITGDNRRWAGRSAVWQEGWRNLHTPDEARISVRLGVDGHRNGGVVECRWRAGAALADRQTSFQLDGRRRGDVADLGWAAPLELYRPFLSYAELGGLLGGRPSEMYDSLQRILGLGRLVEVEARLKTARRDTDQQRKRAAAELPDLRAVLSDHSDPRAQQALQILAAKVPDLDALTALAAANESGDDTASMHLRILDVLALPPVETIAADIDRQRAALAKIEELSGTQAEEARSAAGLLRDALRHQHRQPDQPCPVCGGRILDAAWAAGAEAELDRLERTTEQLDLALLSLEQTREALRTRVPALPPALMEAATDARHVPLDDLRTAWQQWLDLVHAGDFAKVVEAGQATYASLDAALATARERARALLDQRRQAWQPIADRLRAWVTTEQASLAAATMFAALKKAIDWLQRVGAEIRNEKLAPLAVEATSIWNTLRQESNVSLGGIRLAGNGTTRRVDLDASVDGVPAAALGVMSQGELHSLALSLFLPRATMADSPFRFLVIDDPVQSMDPVKVYGLAEVLNQVAKTRQVIVFTHDDRLPAAVRHLQIRARVLTVSRLPGSRVAVASGDDADPAQRYLNDARAVARDEKMCDEARVPIVCGLIRDAIEYTCQEAVRIRGFRTGLPVAETEDALAAARGLRPTLALALLGSADRISSLHAALLHVHRDAPQVVRVANAGAHGGRVEVPLPDLVEQARRVVARLVAP